VRQLERVARQGKAHLRESDHAVGGGTGLKSAVASEGANELSGPDVLDISVYCGY
jgi:hypothetical protein